MEWLFGTLEIVGLACLAIAGIVALTKPIENWRPVALRLAVLGAVLMVGGLIIRAITTG
jgi:hypothetical protein